ncbi:hypothetical protein [Hydrogenobaculum phage 1]|uniref:hypothetical protein n=1 Tax=Hydrogenobaculum phage 1 TaxID=1732176 RepID=UPI0007069006|nr:hypothetical protein AUR69_gp01 [Hydrogenobaculum phage 1]ALG96912.1 hypothetical protein [Hydrogenobaculum phage 1]
MAQLMGAFKPPKLPKIELPKELFDRLNARIQAIAPLSEEARKIATQALEKFRTGQLDDRYKAQLDLMYAQKKAQAKAMLAARGLEGSSIEQEVMNEIDKWYQQNYYGLLNQQLQDALTMAGLGQSDINALMEELKAYGVTWAGLGAGMQAGSQIWAGRTIALGQAGQTLGQSLEKLAGSTGVTTSTGTTQGLNLSFQDLDLASKFSQNYQPTQWFEQYDFGG